MKPALLVIDVQERFFKADAQAAQSLHVATLFIMPGLHYSAQKSSDLLCPACRRKGSIYPGAEGFDLPEALQICRRTVTSSKPMEMPSINRASEQLRELEVDTVILSGYCADSVCWPPTGEPRTWT